MKLRKEDFRGTGQVYRFTLIQLLKSRANLASAAIMLLFALFSIPVYSFFNGDSDIELSNLRTIYYQNDSGCQVDFSKLKEDYPQYEETVVKQASFALEDWQEQLGDDEAFVHLMEDGESGGFLTWIYCQQEDEEEMDTLTQAVSEFFASERYRSLGITDEQIAKLSEYYTVSADTVDNYQDAAAIGADTSFAVQYIYAILVLILCMFSTTFIVRAIIEEKASKLVETLLISVRPLALVLGKILAVMTYVFGLLILMIAGVGISYGITGIFMGNQVIDDMIAGMGLTSDMLRLGPSTILIILISLVLGYFTFSIIGGIAGTSCSSMEDVESANMNVVLFVLGGYMISCFTAAFGGVVGLVTAFIPFASVFCAPVQYVLGNISFPVLCLAWLVQLILLVFLAGFCASIYNDLIMYRGNKMKFRNMVLLALGKKRGGGVK